MDGDSSRSAAAHGRDRERLVELQAEVTRLQAELERAHATGEPADGRPRWRWPLAALLADHSWWDEWLPRLNELLGRGLEYGAAYGDAETGRVIDDRGYADLMSYLFPVVHDDRMAPLTWNSAEYAHHARLAWERKRSSTASTSGRPVRAEVWEPSVRHVALALTALEATSQSPNDAYAHQRVQAEIRGEWFRTLGALLDESLSQRPVHLLRQRLP